jgi:hypothetical protein
MVVNSFILATPLGIISKFRYIDVIKLRSISLNKSKNYFINHQIAIYLCGDYIIFWTKSPVKH